MECPSGPDILKGPGANAGRDCSGRGICDYERGVCECFDGYSGIRCQNQARLNYKHIIDIIELTVCIFSITIAGRNDVTSQLRYI